MADSKDELDDPNATSCAGGKVQATASGTHWNKVRNLKTAMHLISDKRAVPKGKPELGPVEISMHISRS